MTKQNFLFFIIFLEGYVVLSTELLAIRQIVPYVGSGTDTVSIIIAAVLMPMAFGYFRGGQFERHRQRGKFLTVRKKLLSNIFIASTFLLFGLSYVFIEKFFNLLSDLNISNRHIQTTLYSLLFIVTPVYLLAQTIPLTSNFFKKEKLNEITGKILFISTVGSFMGAIFSTLILMAFLGVHYTATATIGLLAVLFIISSRPRLSIKSFLIIGIFCIALAINSGAVMRSMNIVENNKYNTIKVIEGQNGLTRTLMLNNNNSSLYLETPGFFPNDGVVRQTSAYIDYIFRNYIEPTLEEEKVYSILVIGAGGFTLGIDDDKNDYTFIDIDGSLKDISEKYFLKKEIGENKKFIPSPARAFVYEQIKNDKKYDLIVLDTFLGTSSIPEHLVTEEFYQDVRRIVKDDGIILGNFIVSEDFSTAFSIKLDNTLHRVFPHITRQIIIRFKPKPGGHDNANILYIFHNKKTDLESYYTDNHNTIYYDKNKVVD